MPSVRIGSLAGGGETAADALVGAAHDRLDGGSGVAFEDRALKIPGAGEALGFHHRPVAPDQPNDCTGRLDPDGDRLFL